jgi:protein-tyrosine-phosphatase
MASQRQDEGSQFRVLFVCTGNICRSALAERVAKAYLEAAVGDEATELRLESAGTRAMVGSGVHEHSSAVLTALGGDPTEFAARQLTDELAVGADLTLALTRDHRRSVLRRNPRGLSRTFTLLEAADLAALVPADAPLPGASFADRCRSLVREMAVARARRAGDARDDIPDPISESLAFHEEVGDAIAQGVVRLFGRFADLSSAPHRPDSLVEEPAPFFVSGR